MHIPPPPPPHVPPPPSPAPLLAFDRAVYFPRLFIVFYPKKYRFVHAKYSAHTVVLSAQVVFMLLPF